VKKRLNTRSSRSLPVSKSVSLTRSRRGSEARTRMPTACCVGLAVRLFCRRRLPIGGAFLASPQIEQTLNVRRYVRSSNKHTAMPSVSLPRNAGRRSRRYPCGDRPESGATCGSAPSENQSEWSRSLPSSPFWAQRVLQLTSSIQRLRQPSTPHSPRMHRRRPQPCPPRQRIPRPHLPSHPTQRNLPQPRPRFPVRPTTDPDPKPAMWLLLLVLPMTTS